LIKHAINELTQLDNSIFTLLLTPTIDQTATFNAQYWGARVKNVKREVPTSQYQAQTKPAPQAEIVPVPFRFENLDECQSVTKNCTGHGKCSRIFSTGGDKKTELFQCMCKPTVETSKDGKKSTYQWAGNACQKIDVSIPFWLLAGTSVFLLTAISLGIGMLYSMGNEELPSVIGAGVSGPKPK
jgi:hypothetical protein